MPRNESAYRPLAAPIEGTHPENPLMLRMGRGASRHAHGGVRIWFSALLESEIDRKHRGQRIPEVIAAGGAVALSTEGHFRVVDFVVPEQPTVETALAAFSEWMKEQGHGDGTAPLEQSPLAGPEARAADPEYWQKQIARDHAQGAWNMATVPVEGQRVVHMAAPRATLGVATVYGDRHPVESGALLYTASRLVVAHAAEFSS